MSRETLPNRRGAERLDFRHDKFAYRGTVSHFADGRLAETFITPDIHSGTLIEGLARDLAVTASLALQHGVSAEQLRSALTRDENNVPSSPLGALLDIIALPANAGEGEV
jgi:hypothetical protein